MSFRARVVLAVVPLALLPLVLFALAVRDQLGGELEASARDRAAETAALIREDIERRGDAIARRLDALARAAADDNELRARLVSDAPDRGWLIDWAGRAAATAGLDLLRLQDADGRIVSSALFRNEYDRIDAVTPGAFREASDAAVVVRARTAEGSAVALARARRIDVGTRTLWLIGGERITDSFVNAFARTPDVSLALRWPGGDIRAGAPEPADAAVAETVTLPFVDAVDGTTAEATFRVAYPEGPLAALRARVDRWLIGAAALAALLALVLAQWIASAVTRPLHDLARTASRVDLDRLDVRFPARRGDEVGTLAGVLQAMTGRLRTGAAQLREAERRATVGDIARQVNHDIRNGLVPIRNVVRHLGEVAEADPAAVADVLNERRGTLESGIAYLESLATNYARLSPRAERRPCDLNAIVRDVFAHAARDGGRATMHLDDAIPAVAGDPVALRRIVENLVVNALESLPEEGGTVSVSTSAADAADGRVLLEVADTGVGMTAEQQRRAFEDFYTTKAQGTGLGLSIVRRLVADQGGSIRCDSDPGRGTRFRIELETAP